MHRELNQRAVLFKINFIASLHRWIPPRLFARSVAGLLVLLCCAHALQADVPADFRGQPGTSLDRWDVFSKAVGENRPDVTDSGNGFILRQTARYRGFIPPGPFLVQKGNSIYSGDQVMRFSLRGKPEGTVTAIVLQLQFDASGPGLDQDQVFLISPALKEKLPPANITIDKKTIQDSTLHRVTWQLAKELQLSELEIQFQADGVHSSFQAMSLDIATAEESDQADPVSSQPTN